MHTCDDWMLNEFDSTTLLMMVNSLVYQNHRKEKTTERKIRPTTKAQCISL